MAKTQNGIKKTISEPQLVLELKKLFESGNTSKTNSYELLRTKYRIAKNRCLKAFDIALNEWQEIKNKTTAESIEANQKEVLKTANLTKIDRILIAEEIAIGKPKKIGNDVIIISPMERLRALDYLAKIHSDYAPTRTDITTNGQSISSPEDRESRIQALIEKFNSSK